MGMNFPFSCLALCLVGLGVICLGLDSVFYFYLFETGSHTVFQAGLEFAS